MIPAIANWPFLPEKQRTPEQNERWWAECHLPSPADVTLQGIPHSVIVYGGPGSGKSVTLKSFERLIKDNLLILHYPIHYWPEQPTALAATGRHVGQIIAGAETRIKTLLTQEPAKLAKLSRINIEYVRWLIERHGGARAYQRWADALEEPRLLALIDQPFIDLYPTDTEIPDVQGQIEELITVSRRLGFEGVVVLVDLAEAEVAAELIVDKVQALFGWLPPHQFEGFAIKAALPQQVVEQANLIERTRGRVSFSALQWSVEACLELSHRHLRAASDGQLTSLNQVAGATLLADLKKQLCLLYEQPSPGAWVQLTQVLVAYYLKSGKLLTGADYEPVIRTYFNRYVPLKFDPERRGVWRGPQLIVLDPQPFSFLEVLWHYRKGGDATRELLKVADNQGNLNTLASRLRKKIEPVPSRPVYIHNSRSQGYWLENTVDK